MLRVIHVESRKPIMLSHFAECRFAECIFAEYHYTECRGSILDVLLVKAPALRANIGPGQKGCRVDKHASLVRLTEVKGFVE
jgi:hypothetical protein